MRKTCFSPRGSVLSFEGGILLSISLGLAVRTFWSDLEKFPKSASGKILENVLIFLNVPLFQTPRPSHPNMGGTSPSPSYTGGKVVRIFDPLWWQVK